MVNRKNAINPSYKKTSIGVIPEDWGAKNIGSFAKTFSGGTPKTGVKEYYENGTISFIKSGEIYQDYTAQKITDLGLKESSAKMIEKGDLLYALYGANSGEVSISKQNGAINQAVLCIKSMMNTKYLEESLTYLHQRIVSKYLQGGQGNLSAKVLKNVRIPIPPLPEQKAIADCLSTWDRAIEKQTQLIRAKKEFKKGLMQGFFNGHFGFAQCKQLTEAMPALREPQGTNTTNQRLRNSKPDLAIIKAKEGEDFTEDWEEVRLGEIIKRITRKNVELNDTVVTISAQRGFILQEEFFNKRVASQTLSGYYLLHKGEFAYNKSYSNGYPMGAFKRLDDFEKAVVTTLYICFEAKKNVNNNFLLYYFDAGMMIPKLMKIAQEGGRAHGLLNIGLSDFFDLKIRLPKLEKQLQIAQALQAVDKEIELLEEKLAQLQLQKKGLMQVLLTGKKRLV